MQITLRWLCLSAVFLAAGPSFAQLKVVTTLPDYGALVKTLGGDKVDVRILASPTEDPHYVDPKPSYIVALNRADLMIMNGGELEIGWIPKLLVQARNPKLQPGQPGYLKISNHIKHVLEVPKGKIDRSMGDIHAGGNPHFYYDPARMHDLLPVIAQRLSALDPDNKDVYASNLSKAQAEFTSRLTQWRAAFKALTPSQRRVIGYHKSLSYLFETFEIKVLAYLEPKPGISPTPSHVARVLSTMKRDGVKTIVQESYYPTATSKTLAKIVSGQVVSISAGVQPGQDYLTHIGTVVQSVLTALRGGS